MVSAFPACLTVSLAQHDRMAPPSIWIWKKKQKHAKQSWLAKIFSTVTVQAKTVASLACCQSTGDSEKHAGSTSLEWQEIRSECFHDFKLDSQSFSIVEVSYAKPSCSNAICGLFNSFPKRGLGLNWQAANIACRHDRHFLWLQTPLHMLHPIVFCLYTQKGNRVKCIGYFLVCLCLSLTWHHLDI